MLLIYNKNVNTWHLILSVPVHSVTGCRCLGPLSTTPTVKWGRDSYSFAIMYYTLWGYIEVD